MRSKRSGFSESKDKFRAERPARCSEGNFLVRAIPLVVIATVVIPWRLVNSSITYK